MPVCNGMGHFHPPSKWYEESAYIHTFWETQPWLPKRVAAQTRTCLYEIYRKHPGAHGHVPNKRMPPHLFVLGVFGSFDVRVTFANLNRFRSLFTALLPT